MCGRYYIDDETAKEIEKLVRQVDERLQKQQAGRDIHPADTAPVLYSTGKGLDVAWQKWGFPASQGKGIMFNARAESVLEKRSFQDSILQRRCIIPAGGFYEWNKSKEKYTFYREDDAILFMAGFYKFFKDGNRFVILTTQANPSVSTVHERMPLILEKNEIHEWVMNESRLQVFFIKITNFSS